MQGPQAHWLPDRKRLHLNHGPIDLILEAFGACGEVEAAYAQAVARFQTVLTELVDELPGLRRPVAASPRAFCGSTAQRMEIAACAVGNRDSYVAPDRRDTRLISPRVGEMSGWTEGGAVSPASPNFFITPMAAVAGSVADEIMAALVAGRAIDRAYVNNGGDIALHLAPGEALSVAVAGTGHGLSDRVMVRAEDRVRGIATSGWRGRSFSLGIADAVTVLGRNGAAADAAATVIANAVDLPGHPNIQRRPANELAPDSDLGALMVTVDVGHLSHKEIAQALAAGRAVAEDLRRRGLIEAAALFLAGEAATCGDLDLRVQEGWAQSAGGGGREKRLPSPRLTNSTSVCSFAGPSFGRETGRRTPPTSALKDKPYA